jgi:choline dehydrogenase-like flavoprotein
LISPIGRLLLTDGIREHHTKSYGDPRISAHLKNVVRDIIPSIKFAFSFTWGRFFRRGRKLPGFFVKSADNAYPLHYHGEHLPHWDSRIELTDERDNLGMRRIKTHTYFSDEDYRSVRKAIELIDNHLRRHGVGQVEWLTDDVEGSVQEFLHDMVGFHQVGTTRMSASPADGVVDRNLQVHGVRGLYVAATSVLPTSGQANPTLVGVALGVRLVDQLVRARVQPQLT